MLVLSVQVGTPTDGEDGSLPTLPNSNGEGALINDDLFHEQC